MNVKLFGLCASVSALALTSNPAYALGQAADEPAPPAQMSTTEPGPVDSGLAEIVVTSQKRTENSQKAAAAVTVLAGDSLVHSGITDIRAATALVPGGRFQAEGPSTQVFLRGVGSALDFGNIEPTVSFNFNSVFIPREGTSSAFFDIERVEVLPGPQGTLYGRSAIGGTINISFKRPSDENSIEGIAEVGNYSAAHGTLIGNAQLSDGLAIRAAVDYNRHDGYMKSGADSLKDLGVRLGLQYSRSPVFTAYLWVYYANKNGSPPNLVNKGLDAETGDIREDAYLGENPWDDTLTGNNAQYAIFSHPKAEGQIYDHHAIGGQFDLKLGNAVLTWIPSYLYLNTVNDYWLGNFPATLKQKYDRVTQEFRLSGQNSGLNWLVGLYGYQVVNTGLFTISPGTLIRASDVQRNRLKGVALFGQATYSLTPALRVTVGGRYGIDNRAGRGFAADASPYTFERDYKNFDYKIGAEYDVTRTSMAYLTFQTGYRPGTYNEKPSTPTFDNAVKPGHLYSITGGLKNRLFSNRLQLNAEGFYYDYRDLYIQAYDTTASFNPIFSARKIRIWGVQGDVAFQPTGNDRIDFAISYVNAKNVDFITPTGQNFDGFRLPYTPQWTVSGGANHDFVLRNGYIRAQVQGRYESSFHGNFTDAAGTFQKAVFKADANLTFYTTGERFSLGAFIKNIGNVASIAAIGPGGIPGPALTYLQPPRTFGLRGTFKY